MSVVLFLDFDGVTHPDRCFDLNFFCRLPLIEEVVGEFPLAKIVISSSWRDYHSLDDMVEYFARDIRTRVIGTTPNAKSLSSSWLPTRNHEFERQWECELWMEENRHWGDHWIAIDDRPYWFEPDCSKLLVTNPATGFQPGDQATLRQMLKERT